MRKAKSPYPAKFGEEAIRLAKREDKPVSQIACGLGVSFESLRHWIKQAEIDRGDR